MYGILILYQRFSSNFFKETKKIYIKLKKFNRIKFIHFSIQIPKRELGLQNFSITFILPSSCVYAYVCVSSFTYYFLSLFFEIISRKFLIIFQIENLKLKNRQHFTKTSYIFVRKKISL